MEKYLGFEPVEVQLGHFYLICACSDAERMEEIAHGMERYYLSIWYDKGTLSDGERKIKIDKKIRRCCDVILFVTRGLLEDNDPWVRQEYQLAKKYKKKIYVLFFEDLTTFRVHPANQSFHNELLDRQGIILYNIYAPSVTEMNYKIIKKAITQIRKSNSYLVKRKIIISVIFAFIFIMMWVLYPSPPNIITFDYTVTHNKATITGIQIEIKDKKRQHDAFELIIPDTLDGYEVEKIDEFAFAGYFNMTSAFIPDTVISIGDYAFYGCANLEHVDIPKNISYIGKGAFKECTVLSNVAIPNGITNINAYTFEKTNLYSIDIPESVTDIGMYAFAETNIKDLIIPASVITIGEGAFQKCENLNDITMSDGVKSIGNRAFMNCYALSHIRLSNQLSVINEGVFLNCHNLKQITLPEYANAIHSEAFVGCNSLETVEVSAYLTYIDEYAFDNQQPLTFRGPADCYTEKYANNSNYFAYEYR